jgi:hypothetical protein
MIEPHQAVDWPEANRPQDFGWDGSELTFEPYVFVGPLPRAFKVSDVKNRSCMYVASYTKIVKLRPKPRALSYTTHGHGRAYPDLMPQAIVAEDVAGNMCCYLAVPPAPDGKMKHCWRASVGIC